MSQQNMKTPVMVLQEFVVKHGYSPPEYILTLSKTGTHEDEFQYNVSVANIWGYGFGRSKRVAKHNAASNALDKLAKEGLYDPSSNPAQEFNAQSHRNESDSPLKPPVNFIGSLKEICWKYKLPCPLFTELPGIGPPHCRVFTYECNVASILIQASANTKKRAKQLAARTMLESIPDICPELMATQCEADVNALMEKDHEAAKKYNEPTSTFDIIPSKAVEVKHFMLTIKEIMKEKRLTFLDFQDLFANRNRDGLDYIFEALDIKYKIELMQKNPAIAFAIFELETPFTVISMGNNRENAELNVVYDIFKIFTMNVSD